MKQSEAECIESHEGEIRSGRVWVTLTPARSCVCTFDLTSMHFYLIWHMLLGGKCAS